MTPGELVEYMEADIWRADPKTTLDWKFMDEEDKNRIHTIALELVLAGWSK